MTPTGPDEGDPVADERAPEDWLAAFAERIGVPAPDAATVEALLELAGVAAHASRRTAAPVACWLAAQAGLDPTTALTISREI